MPWRSDWIVPSLFLLGFLLTLAVRPADRRAGLRAGDIFIFVGLACEVAAGIIDLISRSSSGDVAAIGAGLLLLWAVISYVLFRMAITAVRRATPPHAINHCRSKLKHGGIYQDEATQHSHWRPNCTTTSGAHPPTVR